MSTSSDSSSSGSGVPAPGVSEGSDRADSARDGSQRPVDGASAQLLAGKSTADAVLMDVTVRSERLRIRGGGSAARTPRPRHSPARTRPWAATWSCSVAAQPWVALGLLLLSGKGAAANAAVTVVHSGVADIASYTRSADILVAGIGQPSIVTPDMVRAGAVVISAGISWSGKRLLPDVDESVARKRRGSSRASVAA